MVPPRVSRPIGAPAKISRHCCRMDSPSLGANQRLRRAIMDENGGGAGRFIGAYATGDRAKADKTVVARNPDWESGPRCIEVPFFVALAGSTHGSQPAPTGAP